MIEGLSAHPGHTVPVGMTRGRLEANWTSLAKREWCAADFIGALHIICQGLPVAERLAEEALSLPMHPYLLIAQQRYIVERL